MPTLVEAKNKVRELSKKGLEVAESTTMTFAEQKDALDPIEVDIKKWMEEVKSLEFVDEKRKAFMAAAGNPIEEVGEDHADTGAKSIGQQFVQSKNYKGLVERGIKGNFTSGEIEVKTTLTEGTSGTQGPGYQNVNALPTLLPGIVDIKFKPLTVSDLFPGGTTSTPLIRYLVETAVTNACLLYTSPSPRDS